MLLLKCCACTCSDQNFVAEVKCEQLDNSSSFAQDSSTTFETFVKQEIEDDIDTEVCLYFYFVVHCFDVH